MSSLIHPGQRGYDQLDRRDIDAAWFPAPGMSEGQPGRCDILVVGQIERFYDGDGPTDRVPTYGSAFGRRIGGAMINDAVAEERVALRAAILLADYFGRRGLGPILSRVLRFLLRRMAR